MEKLESLRLIRILGYVPLDEDNRPYRSPRSGYSFHTQDQKGYHPPKIYTTEAKAAAQSPVGVAEQVFMFVDKGLGPDITTSFPQ